MIGRTYNIYVFVSFKIIIYKLYMMEKYIIIYMIQLGDIEVWVISNVD